MHTTLFLTPIPIHLNIFFSSVIGNVIVNVNVILGISGVGSQCCFGFMLSLKVWLGLITPRHNSVLYVYALQAVFNLMTLSSMWLKLLSAILVHYAHIHVSSLPCFGHCSDGLVHFTCIMIHIIINDYTHFLTHTCSNVLSHN